MTPYLLVVLDVNHQDSDQALLPPRIVQLPSVPIWKKSCLFYPMRKVSPGMWQLKSVNYFLSSESHLYSMFHVLDYLPHKICRISMSMSAILPISPKNCLVMKSLRYCCWIPTWHLFLPRGTNQASCSCFPLLKPSGSWIKSRYPSHKEQKEPMFYLAPSCQKLIRVVWVRCKDCPHHEAQHLYGQDFIILDNIRCFCYVCDGWMKTSDTSTRL